MYSPLQVRRTVVGRVLRSSSPNRRAFGRMCEPCPPRSHAMVAEEGLSLSAREFLNSIGILSPFRRWTTGLNVRLIGPLDLSDQKSSCRLRLSHAKTRGCERRTCELWLMTSASLMICFRSQCLLRGGGSTDVTFRDRWKPGRESPDSTRISFRGKTIETIRYAQQKASSW